MIDTGNQDKDSDKEDQNKKQGEFYRFLHGTVALSIFVLEPPNKGLGKFKKVLRKITGLLGNFIPIKNWASGLNQLLWFSSSWNLFIIWKFDFRMRELIVKV